MSESSATESSQAVRVRKLAPIKEKIKAEILTPKHPGGTLELDTKARCKEKKAQSNYYMWVFFVAVLIIIGVVFMVTEGKKGSGKSLMRNSNMVIAEKNISSIQKNFPKQEEKLWETVKAAVAYHISSEPDPECPIILLFGSRPDASRTSRCLVEKLGRTLSEVLRKESLADSLHEIDGEVFQNQNADQAKMHMDRSLRKAFQGKPGKKVATVFNLDYLPPCSVLLFHGYCDTDNAVFKDVAMIFTVTLDDRSPWPKSPKDWEPLVMDHLKKLWVDKCPSLPLEKVEAFLSRITNNVVFVRKEESPKC